ncbi:MAG TPA: hypothetical protein VM223_08985 [Planctomycetota bacterium]|nr:hypothetical protein [Planctomycetota bacterium]
MEYFDHRYNYTRLNMRRVEIPIARWFLQQKSGTRILEVGNVLSHYGPVTWPVVDLREPGAINVDVMTWEPEEPIDLLVSISTIEHIGVGKYKRAARVRPSGVLARFRSFLAPGGQAVVTAPTGYGLDRELREGTLGADEVWFMRVRPDRIPVEWSECTMEEALAMPSRACSGRWSGGLMVLLCRR